MSIKNVFKAVSFAIKSEMKRDIPKAVERAKIYSSKLQESLNFISDFSAQEVSCAEVLRDRKAKMESSGEVCIYVTLQNGISFITDREGRLCGSYIQNVIIEPTDTEISDH